MHSMAPRLMSMIYRNRAALVVGLIVALTSSGTAAAVSIVLGGNNTATKTTTITTGRNLAVLQLTNSNSNGGTSARGLGITVPTGRAPITVNANAGKATNLNADLVDGLDASAFLPAAGKAADADKLDGQDSSAFLPANGTAVDADKLNGLNASAFVRGDQHISSTALALQPGDFFVVFQDSVLELDYACPANVANDGLIRLRNAGFQTMNAFADNGGTNPQYASMNSNANFDLAAAAAGEHVTFQVQGPLIATIEIFSVHRATDCHIQTQRIVDP
jgi:hypothetical protein